VLSIIIVTIGELIVSPANQSLAANMSPPNKKGRYMGVHSMVQQVGNSFGIFLGSFLIDNFAIYFREVSWLFMLFLGLFAFYGFRKLDERIAIDRKEFIFPEIVEGK